MHNYSGSRSDQPPPPIDFRKRLMDNYFNDRWIDVVTKQWDLEEKTLHHLSPGTIINKTFPMYRKRLEFIAQRCLRKHKHKPLILQKEDFPPQQQQKQQQQQHRRHRHLLHRNSMETNALQPQHYKHYYQKQQQPPQQQQPDFENLTLQDILYIQSLLDSTTIASMGVFLVEHFIELYDVLVISECLLPEWILLLFMDTHDMARLEALNYIHLQAFAKIHINPLDTLAKDAL